MAAEAEAGTDDHVGVAEGRQLAGDRRLGAVGAHPFRQSDPLAHALEAPRLSGARRVTVEDRHLLGLFLDPSVRLGGQEPMPSPRWGWRELKDCDQDQQDANETIP